MTFAALEMEPSEEEDLVPLVAVGNGTRFRTATGSTDDNNRKKKNMDQTINNNTVSYSSLYRHTSTKKIVMVLASTFLVVVFLLTLNVSVTKTTTTKTTVDHKNKNVVTTTSKQRNPHSGSFFGGLNNVAQPAGAKAVMKQKQPIEQGDDNKDDDGKYLDYQINIAKSNNGHAAIIPSLNVRNLINHWGHYIHDEHRSPYASHLYDQIPREELARQQNLHEQKMKRIRSEWGAWNFHDPIIVDTVDDENDSHHRPMANFGNVDYKDLPRSEFPPNSWQADGDYVSALLSEAKALVHRMTEGIYAEYGWPNSKKRQNDGTIVMLSPEELQQRDEAFKVHILDSSTNENNELKKQGIAQLSQVAIDGLVRKLLHAMMTNDDFYVVLAGHSAAAGVRT
jgi:hypothetical protein